MFHSKRKRDVSGISPSSVAKDAVHSEHAQSDGKSVKQRTSGVEPPQKSRFLVLTKRSVASEDENSS